MKTSLVISPLLLLFTAGVVFAQSPTSSTIRDTVKQQVEQEINQIKSTVTKKAYVGSISSKTDGTVTITNHRNLPRTALLTTDAVIKLAGGKDGTVADIKVGNFVIAMGDADGSGSLTIKRLLVTSKPETETRQVIYGTVSKISASSITVKSKDKDITARLLGSTKYTGITKAADVKVDAKVVLVTAGATTFTTVSLHLFP